MKNAGGYSTAQRMPQSPSRASLPGGPVHQHRHSTFQNGRGKIRPQNKTLPSNVAKATGIQIYSGTSLVKSMLNAVHSEQLLDFIIITQH